MNNPVKYKDPTGHAAVAGDCQSWDTVCWEDRYFNAQGLFRNKNGEYKRQGAPTFRDEGNLEQTANEHPEILGRDDVQFLGSHNGLAREMFLALGWLYDRWGSQAAIGLLAAYEAVGESNNCPAQFCATAYAAITFTVLNRYERCQQPACGVLIDQPMTLSNILLAGCASGSCTAYQGLEHFISGSAKCCFDTNDPTTAIHLATAFSVALDIFSGAYKG